MKTLLILIFVFLILSCLEGNVADNQIKKELKMIIGKRMDIPKEIIPFNLPYSITFAHCLKSKYKLYISDKERHCYFGRKLCL